MIEKCGHKAATYVALVGALVPVGFAVWAETSPITLVWLAYEDGPTEDLSAILFLVAMGLLLHAVVGSAHGGVRG
jgi:hypothetical protein